MEVVIHWFRRDLRLEDNKGLTEALKSGYPVIPLFIFDDSILNELPHDDPRVNFIYDELEKINSSLLAIGSSLLIKKGNPFAIWKSLMEDFSIKAVYTNKDYEPYAIKRDQQITDFLKEQKISLRLFKDQVIFEQNEIVKDDGLPYTVYTPYKNKWLKAFNLSMIDSTGSEDSLNKFFQQKTDFPSKETLGLKESKIKVLPINYTYLGDYEEIRNFPADDKTSYASPHLRFGTISVRDLIRRTIKKSDIYLSELIWREFFMQILFHFPKVVNHNFKSKYDNIQWRNNEIEFQQWCEGNTGYPMVDAGMRQLNETGYMHNRVRMITAGFLCKHLLIDWRWGEAYFAKKLLDYELSANNGNWQWSAGTGCDAAPYFRVFNPTTQIKKFDPKLTYIKTWVKNLNDFSYPNPIVEHSSARLRALEVYKNGLEQYTE